MDLQFEKMKVIEACKSLVEFWKIPMEHLCNIVIQNKKNLKKYKNSPAIFVNPFPTVEHKIEPGSQIFFIKLEKELVPSWSNPRESSVMLPTFASFENYWDDEILCYLYNEEGSKIPFILRDKENNILFNIDPEFLVNYHLYENYFIPKIPLYAKIPFRYHLLPAFIRIRIPGLLQRRHSAIKFPPWPIVQHVELIRYLFLKCIQLVTEKELAYLDFWPFKRKFAACLVHDVDTYSGVKNVSFLSKLERAFGMKSSWYFLSKGYRLTPTFLEWILRRGHEICLHGYNHDGKLAFLKPKEIDRRISYGISRFKNFIPSVRIEGFRSPSHLRSTKLMKIVAKYVDYDMSIPDTEILSQTAPRNGSCSIFPYFSNGLITLPLTIPQDALFRFLKTPRTQILKIWKRKTDWIEKVGGLTSLNTHPDNHFSGNKEGYEVYSEYLAYLSKKEDAWVTLPKEIARWWNFRYHCKIRNINGDFRVNTPNRNHKYKLTIKYLREN